MSIIFAAEAMIKAAKETAAREAGYIHPKGAGDLAIRLVRSLQEIWGDEPAFQLTMFNP